MARSRASRSSAKRVSLRTSSAWMRSAHSVHSPSTSGRSGRPRRRTRGPSRGGFWVVRGARSRSLGVPVLHVVVQRQRLSHDVLSRTDVARFPVLLDLGLDAARKMLRQSHIELGELGLRRGDGAASRGGEMRLLCCLIGWTRGGLLGRFDLVSLSPTLGLLRSGSHVLRVARTHEFLPIGRASALASLLGHASALSLMSSSCRSAYSPMSSGA